MGYFKTKLSKPALTWMNREGLEFCVRREYPKGKPGPWIVFRGRAVARSGYQERMGPLNAGIDLSQFIEKLRGRGFTILSQDRRMVK